MSIGKTNVISVSGGGGDKIYAENISGENYQKGDKVLVNYKDGNFVKNTEYVVEPISNARTYCEPVWFDNDTFSIFSGFTGTSFKYVFNGDNWERTYTTNVVNASQNYFRYVPLIGVMYDNSSNYDYPNKIIDEDGNITTTSYDGYIGNFNDNIWTWKNVNGSSGGIYCNGSNLTGAWGVYTNCVDYDLKRYLLRCDYGSYKNMFLYQISDDGLSQSTVVSSSSILPNNYKCVGCTGLNVGDYVIFRANILNNCASSNGTSSLGKTNYTYSAYKIGESQPIVELGETDLLKSYLDIKNTIWNMDTRHNCLIIGTTNNVYILEWTKDEKAFEEVANLVELPENVDGEFIYNASLNPDKTKLVVYAGDIVTNKQSLFIYDVKAGYDWVITKNNSINYDANISFSGVTTGKVDDEGKVETKIVLPDVIEMKISTDVDLKDNEIIIEGGL